VSYFTLRRPGNRASGPPPRARSQLFPCLKMRGGSQCRLALNFVSHFWGAVQFFFIAGLLLFAPRVRLSRELNASRSGDRPSHPISVEGARLVDGHVYNSGSTIPPCSNSPSRFASESPQQCNSSQQKSGCARLGYRTHVNRDVHAEIANVARTTGGAQAIVGVRTVERPNY
jgi:hypothetical protein